MKGRRLWQGGVRLTQKAKCAVHSACNRLCSSRIQSVASRKLLVVCLHYSYVTGRAIAGVISVWEMFILTSVNVRKKCGFVQLESWRGDHYPEVFVLFFSTSDEAYGTYTFPWLFEFIRLV
jgi:hypothetical protein